MALIKNSNISAVLSKITALLFLACLSFSCSDQGCIDADDFGEYESETIEVVANNSQGSCDFDASKALDSPDQGLDIRLCLTSDDLSVMDENGDQQSSTTGCAGFDDESKFPGQSAKLKNICISQCVQNCFANVSGNTNPEPAWTATTKKISGTNSGITLMPTSEITITANGMISLGDAPSSSLYVQADNHLPHSKTLNWTDKFIDVNAGQSLSIKFSGRWSDSEGNFGGGTNGISPSQVSASDAEIYNGSRRLVAYLIPHPSGYDFDSSQTTESAGSKNVPLLPDFTLLQCSYNAAKEANCGWQNYGMNGYANVSNNAVDAAFPISSTEKAETLTKYGGMIRWKDDGLTDHAFDPFSENSMNCPADINVCDSFSPLPATSGKLIGDATNPVTIPNPSSEYSYKVSFKNIGPSGCNLSSGEFKVKVLAGSGASEYVTDSSVPNSGNDGSTPRTIAVNNTAWSTDHIALEPGQRISIDSITRSVSGVNCGKAIAVRFTKYHDLTILKSGFVRFSMISSSGTGSCAIKGRIINPDGILSEHEFSNGGSVTGFSSDFYEYDNFLTAASTDPLSNLSVSPLAWTTPVFVRKGQKIRFSPESWVGTWNSASVANIPCGIGMAMKIEPRPALLCRGKGNDLIDNPSCLVDESGGVKIGCQATSPSCLDNANSSSYCPSPFCQKPVACSTNANPPTSYAKTGCAVVDSTVITTCTAAVTTDCCTYSSAQTLDNGDFIPAVTSSTCDSCSEAKRAAAAQLMKITVNNLDHCYDLENYKGKVTNIPLTTGFTDAQLSDANLAKGATLVPKFNGLYGNFENFFDTKIKDTVDGNNAIFQGSSVATFSLSGRLRFLLLDGTNFNGAGESSAVDSYNSTDNSVSGANYTGSNGFKVNLSGMLSFSNGKWMSIKLCKESVATPNNCRDYSISSDDLTAIDAQPHLIDIDPPLAAIALGASPVLGVNSNYKFDDSGNLVRTTAKISKDCSSMAAGLYNYCHTYKEEDANKKTVSDDIKALRLTFKIIDPEIPTCPMTLAGANDGIKLANAFYDADTPANVGATCAANETPGEDVGDCQKQFYCGNRYANNSGSYFVKIKIKNTADSTISSLIGTVIKPIIVLLDGDGPVKDCLATAASSTFDGVKTDNVEYVSGATNDGAVCAADESPCAKQYYCKPVNSIGMAERIYKSLITDSRYKAIVQMSLVMMFTFYGIGTLIGTSNLTHTEITGRIVKIGLIYLFIGETGWYWFNTIVVNFFKGGTDYLAFMMASSFDDSQTLNDAITNQNYYDKSILFSSVDRVFGLIFSEAVMKKVSALLFASIFGWLYLIIICSGFMLYVSAVANAVLLYLAAQIFISILFTLGPIFFVFTLFAQTKDMFDNWLKQLITFSLQQIFLLTTLAFFNMMIYEVIKLSLGYKICWEEVWTINIITRVSLLSWWNIASLPPRTNQDASVGNIGNPEGIPSLFSILFIWVIASLMSKFITFMTDVAASIGGGLKASKLSEGVKKSFGDLKAATVDKAASFAYDKSGAKGAIARAKDTLDDKLFDHGKTADDRRQKATDANAKTMAAQGKIVSAGDKAVADFKKNNLHELAGKSPSEQQKMLDGVRDKARDKAAKELGIEKPEDLQKVLDYKSEYTGNSAIGYASHLYNQSTARRPSEEKSDTIISEKEAKEFLENADEEDRTKFLKGIEEGAIKVGSKASSSKSGPSKEDIAEAKNELVKEGEINEFASWAEGARSDADNDKIRQRALSNRDAKGGIDTQKTDPEVLARLLEKNDEISKLEEIPEEKWATRAATQLMGTSSEEKSKAKESASRIAEAMPSRITAAKKSAQEELKENNSAIEKLGKSSAETSAAIENNPAAKDIKELRKEAESLAGKSDPESKAKLKKVNQKIEKREKDPDLTKLKATQKAQKSKMSELTAKGTHIQSRVDTLKKAEEAEKVKEELTSVTRPSAPSSSSEPKDSKPKDPKAKPKDPKAKDPKAKPKDPKAKDHKGDDEEGENNSSSPNATRPEGQKSDSGNGDDKDSDEEKDDGGNQDGNDSNEERSDSGNEDGDTEAKNSDDGNADKKLSPAKEKAAQLMQASDDEIADKSQKIENVGKDSSPKKGGRTRGKAISKITSGVRNIGQKLSLSRQKSTAEKEKDKLKKVAPSTLEKVDRIVEGAQRVLDSENSGSEVRKNASETMKRFSQIKTSGDFDKFVKSAETQAKEVEKKFAGLKTEEQFQDFHEKYKTK